MNFSTQYSSDQARILAYTVVALIPALIFYAVAERQHRRRPHVRRGEGLMTTIEARYRDPSAADRRARRRPAGADDARREARPAGVAVVVRAVQRARPSSTRSGCASRLADGIGQVSRVAGATNLDAAGAAEARQRDPALPRRGDAARDPGDPPRGGAPRPRSPAARPSFQQSIGAAAAFDPELVEAIATTIRRRMLAIGARLALAPVLDITRDPRWGRVEETYGEDPYLATALGVAYVRGMQGDDVATGVVATGKHLVGHGLAEGGLNQAPAHARAARAARRAAGAVRGRRPRGRAGVRDAGLLRRRRRCPATRRASC